jgi:hypothetical protein
MAHIVQLIIFTAIVPEKCIPGVILGIIFGYGLICGLIGINQTNGLYGQGL